VKVVLTIITLSLRPVILKVARLPRNEVALLTSINVHLELWGKNLGFCTILHSPVFRHSYISEI
jgi:hypothetical protein